MLVITSEYQKKVLQSALQKIDYNRKIKKMSTVQSLVYSINKQAELNSSKK